MDNKDIAPALLEAIEKLYTKGINDSEIIKNIKAKAEEGQATYPDADLYAKEVARILGKAYEEVITEEALPNGKLYYNISKRVLEPTIKRAYEEVADITELIQTSLNKKAGLGIKAIRPNLNQDRIDVIIDRLAQEAQDE